MPDAGTERPRFCSQCGQPVMVADANFCKECGAPLAGTVWFSHDITWHPLTALLLSIVPGMGQWYKGQPRKAVLWFVSVSLLYFHAPPIGFLLHVICAGNASLAGAIREEAVTRSARRRRGRGLSAVTGPRL